MTKDDFKAELHRAEIKRIGERLTKKELCNIYGFNYQFYMNAVSGRNTPSKKMADELEKYLDTPTDEVYKLVFQKRSVEDSFHLGLEIDESLFDNTINQLKETDSIHIQDAEIALLRKSVEINEVTREYNDKINKVDKEIQELERRLEQGYYKEEELDEVSVTITAMIEVKNELENELEHKVKEIQSKEYGRVV